MGKRVGGGGGARKFYRERLRPEVQTLTLYTPFSAKITLSYSSRDNGTRLTYLQYKSTSFFGSYVRDILKGPFKYLNDSFPCSFLYFIS